MAKEDYYRILEVDREASKDDLKKAYRKLAMKYHPDRNPGDPDAERHFKDVNEAYEVLKDEQKRAAYDRFGHAAFEQGAGMDGGFGGGFAGGGFGDIFEEMFGEFMGGRRGGRSQGRGSDLRFNLEISLDEAFNGLKKTICVPSHVNCETCKGSGSAGTSGPETCSTCRGPAAFAPSRVFLPSRGPVPPVAEPARRSVIHAVRAAARAVSSARSPSR